MHYVYEGCCGSLETSRICRLAEYEADPTFKCPKCGLPVRQKITAPRILANTKPFEAFKSPVDGSVITCQRELREHNKRNDVVNIHEGYDEKALKTLGERNPREQINKELSASLKTDAAVAMQKLNEGYKPQVAQEDAPL